MMAKVRNIVSLAMVAIIFVAAQYIFVAWDSPVVVLEPTITKHPPEQSWWGFFYDKKNPPVKEKTYILLIGDSISAEYRKEVREKLSDVAIVDSWVTPLGEHEEAVLDDLRKILSFRQYDIIHFNTGLHGLGLKPEETLRHVKDYLKNLKQYAPFSQLMWASITPVTVNGDKNILDPVINPAIIEKNRLIALLMQENGIIVNDLYALMALNLNLGRGDAFHWQAAGSTLMAEQIEILIRNNVESVTKKKIYLSESVYYFFSGMFAMILVFWFSGNLTRRSI